MSSRSLTEVFILMRNNAIRNRHIYSEQDNSERMSLISLNDMERGMGSNSDTPPWMDQLDKAHSTMSKLETKINELNGLHSRHLHRPTLDDSSEEEMLIERVTTDISMMFNSAHRLIQHIKSHNIDGGATDQRLTNNVTRSLVSRLQELSMMFRSAQRTYLQQINSREERSKLYFDDDDIQNDRFDSEDATIDSHFVMSNQHSQQQQQMLLLQLEEENAQRATEREHEVNNIVKSIVDLNDIFKELAHMVADQGTILDRIDYNIEQCQTQVYEGMKQLQRADRYQRGNRKMCCIIILAATSILLIILLIIFKT
ncbi:Syntaxin 16 [Carabus blaptoides fortunei]